MSFAALSNDDALAIFSELPVATLLYCLPRMCKKWNSLLATACQARRVLILIDGFLSIEHLPYTIILPYERYLVKEDGSPYLRPLTSAHPAVLSVKQCTFFRRPGLLFSSLAHHLFGLFPNIRRLYIYLSTTRGTFTHIASLIGNWAAQLTTLHLYYRVDKHFYWAPNHETTADALPSILGAINCCTTLRHLQCTLHLNSADNGKWLFHPRAPFRLHLPVLARLSSLYFDTANCDIGFDLNFLLDELRRHVPVAGGPRRVVLHNLVTLSECRLVESHLAQRFIELHILDDINETTLPALATLATRFTSLRALALVYSVSTAQLAGALAPLRHLVYLKLTYSSRQVRPVSADGAAQQYAAAQVRPLGSVKYLHLLYFLPSHEQFRRLALVEHFPNLHLVNVKNRSQYCRDCGYTNRLWPFEAKRFDLCARLAVSDYFRVLPHLRQIITPRPTHW